VLDTYVVSTRLSAHPSDVRSTVEQWHESLPAVTLTRRFRRVGSRCWLATTDKGSSDPLELYRLRGIVWMYGRPIRVMLEFSVWSATASQVMLRPAHLAWPVRSERYGRRVAQVLRDVVASVTAQPAPLVANPWRKARCPGSGIRSLRGLSPRSAVFRRIPARTQTTPIHGR
jgi:hypothetical protein